MVLVDSFQKTEIGEKEEKEEKKKRKKKRKRREKKEERRGKVQVDLLEIPRADKELGQVSESHRFICIWRGWQALVKVFCPKMELRGCIRRFLAGHNPNYMTGA